MDFDRQPGLDVTLSELPAAVRQSLERLEESQVTAASRQEGADDVRRYIADDETIFLPELGHRDTPSSLTMAIAIVLAIGSALFGVGGLSAGTAWRWALGATPLFIVIAVVAGRRAGREQARSRADGIERDGLYLLPAGVVIRSHDRIQHWPLATIVRFDEFSAGERPRHVRLIFRAAGAELQGPELRWHDELPGLLAAWLQAARAR